MNSNDHALVLIRSRWREATVLEREQILSDLKGLGMAMTDVIVALRAAGVFSLGEAKQYVAASPAWREEVERSRPVQAEGRRVLKQYEREQRCHTRN